MNTHALPLLASDFSMTEVIWAAIVTIIFIGSWIANKIKDAGSQTVTDSTDDDESNNIRLEELATRRRSQLQRRAEGGQGAASRPGQPASADPKNLTLAERIERARARAQYAQRAKSLRREVRPEEGGQQPGEVRPQPARSRPQTDQIRPQQPATRKQAPAAPPRRPAAPPRVPDRVPPTRRRARAVPEQPIDLPRSQALGAAQSKREALRLDESTLTSGLAKKASDTRKTSVRHRSGPRGWRGSLQQAIVMKEILDRPLALREPADPSR